MNVDDLEKEIFEHKKHIDVLKLEIDKIKDYLFCRNEINKYVQCLLK